MAKRIAKYIWTKEPQPIAQVPKTKFSHRSHGPCFEHATNGRLLNNDPDGFAIQVSDAQWKRATAVFRRARRALEARGFRLSNHRQYMHWVTHCTKEGHRVSIRIREMTRMQRVTGTWSSVVYVPNGVLKFELQGRIKGAEWTDSKTKPLEDRTEEIIEAIEKRHAEDIADMERSAAEDRRQADELERLAQVERERKAEQERADHLMGDARRWRDSRLLRTYIDELERTILEPSGAWAPDRETIEWFQWARSVAEQMDPVAVVRRAFEGDGPEVADLVTPSS